MWIIYRTTNLINGKTYIGQHKYKGLNDDYMGSGVLISKAIKKYGKENFKKEILEKDIPTIELANDFEQMYILFERTKGKAEYNLADGGRGSKGYKHTKENRQKISENTKKAMDSDKVKENVSNAQKKRFLNISERQKVSDFFKGHTPWNKGKHHNPETKEKLSKAWDYDKHFSPETCQKLADIGQKRSQAYKEYKANGGALKWQQFVREYSINKEGICGQL